MTTAADHRSGHALFLVRKPFRVILSLYPAGAIAACQLLHLGNTDPVEVALDGCFSAEAATANSTATWESLPESRA